MSLDFEYAPYCKTKNCTARIDHWLDTRKGYCVLCQEHQAIEKQEKEQSKQNTQD